MLPMKPYSEDLRARIVRAIQEEGTSKFAAARIVRRQPLLCQALRKDGRTASEARPEEGRWQAAQGGRDHQEAPRRGRVKERPAATITQRRHFLQSITGKVLSDSTVGRLLRRMGFTRKTQCGGTGTG